MPALLLAGAVTIWGQAAPPRPFDQPALAGVSVGADDTGRRALCEELRRLAADPEALFQLPDRGELACRGDAVDRVELRLPDPRGAPDGICRLAATPAPLVFGGMRPFPLNRRSPPSDPSELQLILERLGVRTLGGVLGAFDFASVTLREAGSGGWSRTVDVHELELACRHPG